METKKRIGIGKAHSKIILMGEHAVVYGYSALAFPLKSVEVVCRVMEADHILIWDKEDPLSTAIFAALEQLGIDKAYLTYDIASTVPERRGMGSSAAVAIAAIRAIFDYYQADLSEDLLEDLVNQAERVAHQNPSGLDAKTCLSDLPIKYSRQTGFEQLDLNVGAYLVIADTGLHGKTKEAVQKVANLGDLAQPHLEKLGELAEKALVVTCPTAFGKVMSQAHRHLQAIGVSSDLSDHLVATAINHGALGSKMSGGGLGGCIIALAASQEQAKDLAKTLEKEGAKQTWIERL